MKGKGFWEFFIFHRRFTVVIVVAALAMGLLSVVLLPKESNPEVDVPFGIVTTVFPGAAADDVEDLVTSVVEDRILNLEGVDKVTSRSQEGVSIVSVEFDASADSDRKIDELKDAVDAAKIDFPDEAEDPIVQKFRFSDQPIMTFSLSGPFQVPQLKQFAEQLKDEIERIPGVSRVFISGGQDREIQVIVDKTQLDSFGFSIAQVTSAISGANADIPTGSIETAGLKYSIRLTGRIESAGDIRKIPIAAVDNTPILVSDVAEVIDGFGEKTSISRLSVGGSKPQPAVTISVVKSTGGNILRTTDGIFETIDRAKDEFLPEDAKIDIGFYDAQFIREDLRQLSGSGAATIAIVFVLLLLFLGTREALLAGIAIPLSFLITFIFLFAIDSTINFLSLFSLILALGILIDSAIVIVEGMSRYVQGGYSPTEAAVYSLRLFKWPLIAGTLTTVFAFVPMLLMSGILGEFVKHIPITVTIVLLSSLFVALGVVTSIGSMWLKSNRRDRFVERKRGNKVSEASKRMLDRVSAKYCKALEKLLASRKKKRVLAATLVALFLASVALPVTGVLEVDMFPSQDFGFFFVDIKTPIGTPLEETMRVTKAAENELLQDDRIASFSTTVGEPSAFGFDALEGGPSIGQTHLANIFVKLNEDREENSSDIVNDIQRKMVRAVDAEVVVSEVGEGPPTGVPVEISLSGDSLEELEGFAIVIEDFLGGIPGTRNVKTSIPESAGEFLVKVDRVKAQIFGISTVELAGVLRNAVSGTTATVIRGGGEEMDVLVKYALDPASLRGGKTNVVGINTIQSLTIATPKGDIPLGEFTTIELSGTRPSIQHEDGRRVIKVTSDLSPSTNAQTVFSSVSEKIDEVGIPDGVVVHMGGEREDIQRSYTDMFRAMILAIGLIAATLVLQFNSYRQPLFILVTIPLAFIGVFFGLTFIGQPISFPGIIGIVALVGIVVNNAIILISSVNENRKFGMDIPEAVKSASEMRVRPILLTTVTTVLGILPITLSSELWGPLGYSIIFGLSFSTAFTLFVVPMLYVRFARKRLE